MAERERTAASDGERRRPLFNPIGRIVDTVVPTIADALDVDEIVHRIDIDDVVSRVDLDALLARLDVDALIGRIDLDALISRVDLDAVISRVDLDAVISRVDLDAVISRVDVDAVVDRVDIDRIVQQADLAGIVAQSTRGITASTLDLIRRQLAGVDEILTRVAARLVGRDPAADPGGPPALLDLPHPTSRGGDQPSITGHYAGPVTRIAALSLDWVIVVFLFGVFTALGSWMIDLLVGGDGRDATIAPLWSAVILTVWTFVYFAVPLALIGRTFGKAVVGLRVIGRDGAPLRVGQAVVRVIVLPVSFMLLGLGLIGALFGRRRRTLHDVAARSVEVIDWGDRAAALPSPLNNWLIHRQDRIVSSPTGTEGESST